MVRTSTVSPFQYFWIYFILFLRIFRISVPKGCVYLACIEVMTGTGHQVGSSWEQRQRFGLTHAPSREPCPAPPEKSGRENPTPSFSLGRKRVRTCVQCSNFTRTAGGTHFCLSQPKELMGPAYSRSLGTTNKREVAGLQLLQKTLLKKRPKISLSLLSLPHL